MKRPFDAETMKAIIFEIEKKHKCVIKTDILVASTSGVTSTMNLPYHSMTVVNDKEIMMASGHKIAIVIGNLALQKVSPSSV